MTHFVEFSLLIALAASVSIFMHVIKQPLIIGHIFTGLIAGTFFAGIVGSTEILGLFSEIGIAILLFLVGLHLHPKNIKQFGAIAVITGVGQVVFTSIAGYFISVAIGLDTISALYVGIALAFSSTIIVMKLIGDKGEIDSLYGRIAIGFLLVQDLIAILIMFMLPLVASDNLSTGVIIAMLTEGIILLLGMYLISKFIIPTVGTFVAKSRELLFVFTIAWGLGISALFYTFGFSIESGALVAGISLATLPMRREVSARLTPVRDFFIIMFFILLGAQMNFGDITALLPTAAILSALVLIGNPVILMSIMGALGYKKKTSLQTGFTVAQISEFSLIVIALGYKLGHLSEETVSLVTLVGLITIFGSTYLISYSQQIYKALEKYLNIFERKHIREQSEDTTTYKALIFGAGRTSHKLFRSFKSKDTTYLIIDHDPEIVKSLEQEGLEVQYGDASNIEFIESLDMSDLQVLVSTIVDIDINILILLTARKSRPDTIVIGTANNTSDALALYDSGFDYVIMPHLLGSQHIDDLFSEYGENRDGYDMIRHHHLNELRGVDGLSD
jgi:Kef-type K+ transport system membrane component KefB